MKKGKITLALKETLQIKNGERVLIVTDHGMHSLASIFLAAVKPLSINVKVLNIKPTRRSGAEPSPAEARAMLGHDVLILLTTFSLTHTDARRLASAHGARIASMPGFTMQMMRALGVDYNVMERHSLKLYRILDEVRKKR